MLLKGRVALITGAGRHRRRRVWRCGGMDCSWSLHPTRDSSFHSEWHGAGEALNVSIQVRIQYRIMARSPSKNRVALGRRLPELRVQENVDMSIPPTLLAASGGVTGGR